MDLWRPFIAAASTAGSFGLSCELDLADHTIDGMDDDVGNHDVACTMDATQGSEQDARAAAYLVGAAAYLVGAGEYRKAWQPGSATSPRPRPRSSTPRSSTTPSPSTARQCAPMATSLFKMPEGTTAYTIPKDVFDSVVDGLHDLRAKGTLSSQVKSRP